MESKFEKELTALINSHSMENDSDTPDFILAKYMWNALENFNQTVNAREKHYGRAPRGYKIPVELDAPQSQEVKLPIGVSPKAKTITQEEFDDDHTFCSPLKGDSPTKEYIEDALNSQIYNTKIKDHFFSEDDDEDIDFAQ